MEAGVKRVVRARCFIRGLASEAGRFLIRAPRRRALVMAMESSVSAMPLSMRPRMELRDVSLMFVPALLTTSYRAFSMALRTPASGVFVPVTSSGNNY